MSSSFTRVVVCQNLPPCESRTVAIICWSCIWFIYLSLHRQLCCFYSLAIVYNVAMNMDIQISVRVTTFISLGVYTPQSEMTRSYGNAVFNFLRNQVHWPFILLFLTSYAIQPWFFIPRFYLYFQNFHFVQNCVETLIFSFIVFIFTLKLFSVFITVLLKLLFSNSII